MGAAFARGGAAVILGAALLLPVGLALPRAALAVGTVDGHSMDGTYSVGDVVLTHQQIPHVGDVVRANRDGTPYVHRVVRIDPASGELTLKGDGNPQADPFKVRPSQVEGVVVAHLAGGQATAWRLVNTVPARLGMLAGLAVLLLWPTSTGRRRTGSARHEAPSTPPVVAELVQDATDRPVAPVVRRRDLRHA